MTLNTVLCVDWQEYQVIEGEALPIYEAYLQLRVLPNGGVDVPLSAYLGPLGMPGKLGSVLIARNGA